MKAQARNEGALDTVLTPDMQGIISKVHIIVVGYSLECWPHLSTRYQLTTVSAAKFQSLRGLSWALSVA